MTSRSMGLEKKSILMLAVLLFLAVGLNTFVLTYVTADKYKSVLLSKVVSVGESVKANIEKALGLGIPLDYMDDIDQRLAELLTTDKTLDYALVADKKGKVLFHTEESRKGSNFDVELANISAEKTLTRKRETAYEVILPLMDAEEKMAGIVVLGIKAEVIREQIFGLLMWAAGVGGASFLVFISFVYLAVSRFITKPITDMEKVSGEIATGNLTRQVATKGDDEIAKLGMSINGMASSLKEIISSIRDITAKVSSLTEGITDSSNKVLDISDTQQEAVSGTAESVDEMKKSLSTLNLSAKSLTESAEQTSSAVSEMNNSISKVAESADSFNQTSQDTAASVEEMIASIHEIAKSIESISASSGDVASALLEVNATIKEIEQNASESVRLADVVSTEGSEQGMKAADSAMEGMKSIRQSVGDLSEGINRLGGHSESIGNIVNVIDEITDQTTLLSLNAAILAAQAGEQGKGFSVVAGEIRDLAERTAMSTKEITELISTVQSEVGSSVKMAAEGINAVENGMDLVSKVRSVLQNIQKSSQASTEMAQSIQRATEEEASAIKQITEATSNMNKQLGSISNATQEQSNGAKLILEAMENVRTGASHIKSATSDQLEGIRHIETMTENVYSLSEQIGGSITKQQDETDAIVNSIGSIRKTAEDLVAAANELRSVATAMQEDSNRLSHEIKRFIV